jgi:hypothetical protein
MHASYTPHHTKIFSPHLLEPALRIESILFLELKEIHKNIILNFIAMKFSYLSLLVLKQQLKAYLPHKLFESLEISFLH